MGLGNLNRYFKAKQSNETYRRNSKEQRRKYGAAANLLISLILIHHKSQPQEDNTPH